MKKLLLISMTVVTMSMMSCNFFSNHSSFEGEEDSITSRDKYPPELVEMINQYHLRIDTTTMYDINIKVYQTLSDDECLALECSNQRYGWYNGQLIYYMTSDMVFDDKIIKEKAYLIGTYRYKTVDTIRQYKVVPFYCETNKYETLKGNGFFDLIQEIQGE